MRVTIIDVEWYRKKSFLPNPKCMKISSYYKQKNAIINFPQRDFELKYDYDIMYIVKESIMTDMIHGVNILDERVHLIGPGLKFYSRYQEDIDQVMAACRPDYLLYPLRNENKMSKANIVQFFYNGKLLQKIQDYHNAYKKSNCTYVIDENFWEYSVEEIKKCYNFLKNDNNIVFKFPINLDSVLNEKSKAEIFTSLKIDFSKNDIICNLNSTEKINKFISFAKNLKPSNRKQLTVKAIIFFEKNHFEYTSQPIKDLMRYFYFLDEMKRMQINIILQAPPRKESPFWFYFEDLEAWTHYGFHSSFIEFMSLPNRVKINCMDIYVFFMDSLKWSDDAIDRMRTLWIHYPELMEKVGYRTWGEGKIEQLDMRKIFKTNKFKGE